MSSADCELNIQINTIEPGESAPRDADDMPPGESAITLNNIANECRRGGHQLQAAAESAKMYPAAHCATVEYVFRGGKPVIFRLSAALVLALSAFAVQAQQAVNPKPLTDEERAEINAQRRAGCKAHGENLKMLQGDNPLMIEEGGKQRELTRAERDSQIADTQKILQDYCGEKPKGS